MNYYAFKSIVSATKKPFQMPKASQSFYICEFAIKGFVEPGLDNILPAERPQVILVSAVGVSGKTTLSRQISFETGLPLLDLGLHKPVADNTLSGLITNSFEITDASSILQGLRAGTFGIIIDGVDEARSKTTQLAFEAFLDDIVGLCAGSPNTSFVLLGRNQSMEDCWIYLSGRSLRCELLTIAPFSGQEARSYIDKVADVEELNPHRGQYLKTRDLILDRLSRVFRDPDEQPQSGFNSFIGYPPVLDAIGTLLHKEANYFKLGQQLTTQGSNESEAQLLLQVTSRILEREQTEKVTENIVRPLVGDVEPSEQTRMLREAYRPAEQCLRVLAHCLEEPIHLPVCEDQRLREKYEEQLAAFVPEHPFLSGRSIRNAVFEAYVISTVLLEWNDEYIPLLSKYWESSKPNYHLAYILATLKPAAKIPVGSIGMLVDSAMEFNSRKASADIVIDGSLSDDYEGCSPAEIAVDIEITFDNAERQEYGFTSEVKPDDAIAIHNELASASVIVPCSVFLRSGSELVLTGPIDIQARRIVLSAPSITCRVDPILNDTDIALEANNIESVVEHVATNGADLSVIQKIGGKLLHPLAKYAVVAEISTTDSDLQRKFMRVRRILSEFRSHSKGTLARYKGKIEHARVLKNETGRKVLNQLVKDGILSLVDTHYFLNDKEIDAKLGIGWTGLRRGHLTPKMRSWLLKI